MKLYLRKRLLNVVPCPWHGTHVTVTICRTCDEFKGISYEGDEDNPGDVTAIDCAKVGVTP